MGNTINAPICVCKFFDCDEDHTLFVNKEINLSKDDPEQIITTPEQKNKFNQELKRFNIICTNSDNKEWNNNFDYPIDASFDSGDINENVTYRKTSNISINDLDEKVSFQESYLAKYNFGKTLFEKRIKNVCVVKENKSGPDNLKKHNENVDSYFENGKQHWSDKSSELEQNNLSIISLSTRDREDNDKSNQMLKLTVICPGSTNLHQDYEYIITQKGLVGSTRQATANEVLIGLTKTSTSLCGKKNFHQINDIEVCNVDVKQSQRSDYEESHMCIYYDEVKKKYLMKILKKTIGIYVEMIEPIKCDNTAVIVFGKTCIIFCEKDQDEFNTEKEFESGIVYLNSHIEKNRKLDNSIDQINSSMITVKN